MTVWRLRAVAVLAGCLLITGSMGMMAYRYLETAYRHAFESDMRLQLQALQEDMRLDLGRISNSLGFLVDQVESHLADRSPASMQRLAHDFLSFVRASRIYDQARLLDLSGKEVIRANYNGGKPELVQNGALQQKVNRYYFREGLNLKRGEVYVSPFDLNIEHGTIEKPIKPTIRLVQPAFDAAGRRIGMVVVNVLGDPLLAPIQIQSRSIPDAHVSLLNRDGYWLAGPVSGDLWAFMYPGRQARSMAAREPALWRRILDRDQARIEADGGVYLSDTFYPARALDRVGLHVASPVERVWKLVAYYPDSLVQGALQRQLWVIVGVSLAAGAVLAVMILGMLRLRRQSELRRAAEARAREQAAASEKSKAIVTIAGGVAHEFNNILAGILGSAYLLRTGVSDQPEMQARVDSIERLGERAAELVQHLMTFARVDLHEWRQLSLNEVVAGKVEAVRQRLPESVRLQVSIAEVPLTIAADRSKLEQMLQHLLANAADAVAGAASPEIGVTLGLADAQARVSHDQGWRIACLTVSDNGCGIAADHLADIFDPFFTTKPPGKGTGMGLALVQGVVQSLNGDIKVASSPGEGTTIRILLPLQGGESPPAMQETDAG